MSLPVERAGKGMRRVADGGEGTRYLNVRREQNARVRHVARPNGLREGDQALAGADEHDIFSAGRGENRQQKHDEKRSFQEHGGIPRRSEIAKMCIG